MSTEHGQTPSKPPLPAAFRLESGDPVMAEAVRFVMEFSWNEVDHFAERARSIFAAAGAFDIVESTAKPGIGGIPFAPIHTRSGERLLAAPDDITFEVEGVDKEVVGP
jgi:hypothetical protein